MLSTVWIGWDIITSGCSLHTVLACWRDVGHQSGRKQNAITWKSQESVKGNCSDMHVCICQPMYPKISIRGIRCVNQCLKYGQIDATPEEDGPLFEFPKRSHHWLNSHVLVKSWYPTSTHHIWDTMGGSHD